MLALEMGLGKTIATLSGITDLLNAVEIRRVLIIAPLRVAQKTWPDEIEAWEHTRHLSYAVLCGDKPTRTAKLRGQEDIHIVNRENVPWLVQILGKRWPYDMVVVDESSSFKNRQAKRFKAIKKMLPKIERLVELTGTPAPNGLLDLWAQIFLLDRGKRLGKTYTKYRDTYFKGDYMGWSFELKDGAEETIHDKISDICLSMSAADYLELPDYVFNEVRVALPAGARRQYETLERDFVLEMESGTVEAPFAAALSNKLLQCANGAVYDEDGTTLLVHDEKVEALEEIIESNPGRPILVAYSYKSDLERIRKAFPQTAVLAEDPATIDKWNAGRVPLLVAHPASCGHGLNLQHGGNILVWFGLPWSLEFYQQMNARLRRQGQSQPVFVHHIVAGETVDETVLAALDDKDVTQAALLRALREDAGARVCA